MWLIFCDCLLADYLLLRVYLVVGVVSLAFVVVGLFDLGLCWSWFGLGGLLVVCCQLTVNVGVLAYCWLYYAGCRIGVGGYLCSGVGSLVMLLTLLMCCWLSYCFGFWVVFGGIIVYTCYG